MTTVHFQPGRHTGVCGPPKCTMGQCDECVSKNMGTIGVISPDFAILQLFHVPPYRDVYRPNDGPFYYDLFQQHQSERKSMLMMQPSPSPHLVQRWLPAEAPKAPVAAAGGYFHAMELTRGPSGFLCAYRRAFNLPPSSQPELITDNILRKIKNTTEKVKAGSPSLHEASSLFAQLVGDSKMAVAPEHVEGWHGHVSVRWTFCGLVFTAATREHLYAALAKFLLGWDCPDISSAWRRCPPHALMPYLVEHAKDSLWVAKAGVPMSSMLDPYLRTPAPILPHFAHGFALPLKHPVAMVHHFTDTPELVLGYTGCQVLQVVAGADSGMLHALWGLEAMGAAVLATDGPALAQAAADAGLLAPGLQAMAQAVWQDLGTHQADLQASRYFRRAFSVSHGHVRISPVCDVVLAAPEKDLPTEMGGPQEMIKAHMDMVQQMKRGQHGDTMKRGPWDNKSWRFEQCASEERERAMIVAKCLPRNTPVEVYMTVVVNGLRIDYVTNASTPVPLEVSADMEVVHIVLKCPEFDLTAPQ